MEYSICNEIRFQECMSKKKITVVPYTLTQLSYFYVIDCNWLLVTITWTYYFFLSTAYDLSSKIIVTKYVWKYAILKLFFTNSQCHNSHGNMPHLYLSFCLWSLTNGCWSNIYSFISLVPPHQYHYTNDNVPLDDHMNDVPKSYLAWLCKIHS